MKKVIVLLLFFISFGGYSQKISFSYDAAGNQVQRSWCAICTPKMAKPTKEIKDLVAADLQKFLPEDTFSYYPNPVKEQLYLKWERTDNSAIAVIRLISMSGTVLKSIENLEGVNNQTVDFQNLPEGLYVLELTGTSGEVKTIKIIKQ